MDDMMSQGTDEGRGIEATTQQFDEAQIQYSRYIASGKGDPRRPSQQPHIKGVSQAFPLFSWAKAHARRPPPTWDEEVGKLPTLVAHSHRGIKEWATSVGVKRGHDEWEDSVGNEWEAFRMEALHVCTNARPTCVNAD